jgi:thioredoxin 1
MPQSVTAVSDADFQRVVVESALPVMVDFWAEWCGPCRLLAPMMDELQEAHQGRWMIVKANLNDVPQIAEQLKIASLPTIVIYHDGRAVERRSGLVTRQVLETMMESVVAG